jgi:hypothetical protein
MPYSVRKTPKGYGVLNTETGEWRSRDTSKANAESQFRLLQGIEHGWQPTRAGSTHSRGLQFGGFDPGDWLSQPTPEAPSAPTEQPWLPPSQPPDRGNTAT